MATGFEFFERDLRVATAGMEPEAINRAVATFARQELSRVITEGIASPDYQRYVNGIPGAPEEAYKAPGSIVYEFTNWPLVIQSALAELQKRSPRKSGRFAASFIVIVGGRIVTDYRAIPATAEVIIVNFQPYTRKAETGLLKQPRRYVFDGTKRVLNARFNGVFKAETRFLNIASGIHPEIPYILKGHVKVRAAVQNNRSSAFRAGRTTLASRKETVAGQPLTYPAVVINAL
jgi:hypothetical protein